MTMRFSFTLNGRPTEVTTNPVKRLAHVLRDNLGLTGTKIGCDAGDCGACTVLIDGRLWAAPRVNGPSSSFGERVPSGKMINDRPRRRRSTHSSTRPGPSWLGMKPAPRADPPRNKLR